MRLTELEPKWTASESGRHGMGVSFLCPVHHDHRLAVGFVNTVDGGPAFTDMNYLWQRSGETFDTLTLGPSVDASSNAECSVDGMVKTSCWHGFIKNGEVTLS